MRQNKGWIKLHRSTLDNPVVMKSAAHFAVWCLLLLLANNSPNPAIFNGKKIELQPGQLITGRKDLCNRLNNGFSESKVERILNDLENEQQIEQQKSNKGRLITLLNWSKYQKVNSTLNNNRTTSEQQVNNNRTLNKNIKNIENIKKDKNYSYARTHAREEREENVFSFSIDNEVSDEQYENSELNQMMKRVQESRS